MSIIKVNYVPAWMAGVASYKGVGITDPSVLENAKDKQLYHLANLLVSQYFTKLKIFEDYMFPAAQAAGNVAHDQYDHSFALFGHTEQNRTLNEFTLDKFDIVPGTGEGEIILIQRNDDCEPRCIVTALLHALNKYAGRTAAYSSATMREVLRKG